MTHTDLVKLLRADLCSFVLAHSNPVSLDLPAYQRISADIEHCKLFWYQIAINLCVCVHDQVRRMQACKLIMFHYAYTHVLSGIWSGSAANGVLRKRAQIGAPVRKGTLDY